MNLHSAAQNLRQDIRKNGNLTLEVRKKRLSELKKSIIRHEGLISQALKTDLGKSSFESYATEVGFVLEEIGFLLKHIDSLAKPLRVKTPLTLFPGKSFIYPEPYGVVLIISPWNYPFQLCLAPLIGAIAAGNRIVVKPSEFAPATASAIRKVLEEVFESEEVQVIEGGVEETQSLLKQRFDYIFFTGSTSVGKIMMKAAAENLTPITLELGGKSPLLVEESANLDITAKRCVWGKFLNAGQTCVAPDYVLVPEALQDKLLERMGYYLKLFYGDDIKSSADYPRIVNQRHWLRLQEMIVPEKVVIGGTATEADCFIEPTIMKNVSWSDKVMEDEIFGPLLPVIPYGGLEEALEMILKNPKPLAFYVFSEDETRKKTIIDRIPFGGGCINDTVVHLANPNLPFGGVGPSGLGSYHGKKTFETFTHFKSVYEQGTKVDLPFRYPPYEGKLSWIKLFIR